MADTFNDPEFGTINLEVEGWTLSQPVMFNGVEVPVRLDPESEGPSQISPVQRQALRQIMALSPDVLEKAAPAVVQNYEVYREMIGDDEEVPPLGSPVEVWQQVEPDYFLVTQHEEVTTPTFFLYAECDWDPEHGLMVRFRNGEADASNQQGELRMTD